MHYDLSMVAEWYHFSSENFKFKLFLILLGNGRAISFSKTKLILLGYCRSISFCKNKLILLGHGRAILFSTKKIDIARPRQSNIILEKQNWYCSATASNIKNNFNFKFSLKKWYHSATISLSIKGSLISLNLWLF